MDRVLLTKQTRSDTPWAAFGIIVVFGLATASALIAAGELAIVPVRAIASAASILLVAIGLRGFLIYFQRRAYTFTVGTEEIAFGWVHKPKRHTRLAIDNIAQVHWRDSKNDALITLRSGQTLKLPLHAVGISTNDLRRLFDGQFPQIESIG